MDAALSVVNRSGAHDLIRLCTRMDKLARVELDLRTLVQTRYELRKIGTEDNFYASWQRSRVTKAYAPPIWVFSR